MDCRKYKTNLGTTYALVSMGQGDLLPAGQADPATQTVLSLPRDKSGYQQTSQTLHTNMALALTMSVCYFLIIIQCFSLIKMNTCWIKKIDDVNNTVSLNTSHETTPVVFLQIKDPNC